MAELRIVHEDAALLVVDKPHGLPTQGTRDGEVGLYEQLRASRGELYLHHRLDQPASGLVLLVKDAAANAAIGAAFQRHTITRGYRAVLVGSATSGRWTWPVEGRSAATRVTVVGQGAGLSAVELTLETGRKHQIRVHAALAGVPVAGDRRYGGDAGRGWPRLALHASTLSLTHPVTGKLLALNAELPADLAPLWSRAGGEAGG